MVNPEWRTRAAVDARFIPCTPRRLARLCRRRRRCGGFFHRPRGAACLASATLFPPTHGVSMTASRVRLHVEDTGGTGRPVVLIHGWPLSAESWKAQVPVLQRCRLPRDRLRPPRLRALGQAGRRLRVRHAGRRPGRGDRRPATCRMSRWSASRWAAARWRATSPAMASSACTAWCSPRPCRRTCCKTEDNPDGPLTQDKADEMRQGLETRPRQRSSMASPRTSSAPTAS